MSDASEEDEDEEDDDELDTGGVRDDSLLGGMRCELGFYNVQIEEADNAAALR